MDGNVKYLSIQFRIVEHRIHLQSKHFIFGPRIANRIMLKYVE